MPDVQRLVPQQRGMKTGPRLKDIVVIALAAERVARVLWPGGSKVRRGLSLAGADMLVTLAERLVSDRRRNGRFQEGR